MRLGLTEANLFQRSNILEQRAVCPHQPVWPDGVRSDALDLPRSSIDVRFASDSTKLMRGVNRR